MCVNNNKKGLIYVNLIIIPLSGHGVFTEIDTFYVGNKVSMVFLKKYLLTLSYITE